MWRLSTHTKTKHTPDNDRSGFATRSRFKAYQQNRQDNKDLGMLLGLFVTIAFVFSLGCMF